MHLSSPRQLTGPVATGTAPLSLGPCPSAAGMKKGRFSRPWFSDISKIDHIMRLGAL